MHGPLNVKFDIFFY